MNAYELADEMNDACIEFSGDAWIPTFEEVANMLRQQADRIAELEKQSQSYRCHWVEKGKGHCERNNRMGLSDIYTTSQTKLLSDEEIMKCFEGVNLFQDGFMVVARTIEAKVRGDNA